MKKITILIVFLALIIFSYSQTNMQNVYGYITDVESGAPLFGASVVIKSNGLIAGAITDENGQYFIDNVSIGLLEFQISYIGFETVFMNNIRLGSGKSLQLDISLKEALTEIGEITIQA